MKRLVCIFIMMLFCCITFVTDAYNYKAFRKSNGQITSFGTYSWGAWQTDESIIHLDTYKNVLIIGKTKYDILVDATPWRYKQKHHYRYTMISCTDICYNKICVKILYYDNGEIRFIVMGEERAQKYSVVQLK